MKHTRDLIRKPLLLWMIIFLTIQSGKSIATENQYSSEANDIGALYESSAAGRMQFSELHSLEEYLLYAALHNPGLRSAFYDWMAQLHKAGYVGALPDPVLNYGYFIENVETRVGPQNQRIRIRQMIPWFGTLGAKKGIAFESSNAAYQKYRARKLNLFFRVKSAYYDYYYIGREFQLTSENIELLKLWESVARAKYKAGLKQYQDVLKAQVELGLLDDKLETIQARREPIVARLRAALNLPPETDIPQPTTIEAHEEPANRTEILKQIANNNPDIAALSHLIGSATSAQRLASKASYPNFTLGVDYIETGEALNPSLVESGKDPLMLSVGLNLPLWLGKNRAKKREAKANLRRAEYALREKENRLIEITDMTLFRHDDALRKVRLYRDGLGPKAQQSLNAAYTAYEAGRADFLNLLDAQRQALQFRLELDRALSELARMQAQLEALTGNDYRK